MKRYSHLNSTETFSQKAKNALNELDSQKAEELFDELVLCLEETFNKNQKDVAAELQRIAKEIESLGNIDDSLRFKQRTCEIMLKHSMAARRSNQAPSQAAPKESKSFSQSIFVCFAHDPATYSSFLQRLHLFSELRILPDGSRFLRGGNSQLILVCRQGRLSGFFPLFVASSRENALKQLQDAGNFMDGEELDVCGMKMLVLKDKAGQRFLLAGAEILQNI